MTALLRLTTILAILFSGITAYLIWQNNRSLPAPTDDRIGETLENSIKWLTNNRDRIIQSNNPMLWHMIRKASDITDDARLKNLFSDWADHFFKPGVDNIWQPLFYQNTWVPFRTDQLNHLPAYNRFFVYGYTCDDELRQMPEIQAQLDPEYCTQYLFSPACETHQLMGLLLVQQSECIESERIKSIIGEMRSHILKKLVYDPRLSDAYMQRVLMLADSGAADRIKPVWITRLINAQQKDGGWSPFMPIIDLGDRRTIGLNNGKPRLDSPRSNFHMTAQGVLLFALLAHNRTPTP